MLLTLHFQSLRFTDHFCVFNLNACNGGRRWIFLSPLPPSIECSQIRDHLRYIVRSDEHVNYECLIHLLNDCKLSRDALSDITYMMDRGRSRPQFVTNLDAAASVKFTLYRDFIDAVAETHPSSAQTDGDALDNPVSNDEFKEVVCKVLTDTNLFTPIETQSLLEELGENFLFYNAPSQAHLLARSLGLPNLEFALKLRDSVIKETKQLAITQSTHHPENPIPRVKSYSFSLNPEFYLSLLEEIPILKQDFEDNVYHQLSLLYAKTPIPQKRRGMSPAEKQLRVIKCTTINIARALQKKPRTESLQQYSKQTVFAQRALSPKFMNELTKKNSVQGRRATIPNHYNCFRYSATPTYGLERTRSI